MGLRGKGAKPKGKNQILSTPLRETLPWEAEGLSRVERVVAFLEDLPITAGKLAGTKMIVRDWQREFLEAVYREDDDGNRPVRTAILSMARKNGKTGLVAGLALCHLAGPEAEPRGECYAAANDRFQAGKIFAEMVAIISQHPELDARVNIIRFRKEIEVLEGQGKGSVFAALSSDATTKLGLSPSFTVIDELGYPLVAGSVSVEVLKNGRIRYKHALPDGGTEVLLQEECLHLRYRSADGILGMSPIQIAAGTFGLAIAQQDQAGAAAENAFRPAGALVFPDKLGSGTGAGSKEDVIQKFRDRFVGQLKAGEVIVLDGGADFRTFQFSARDSEFLESRKLSNLDIARVYGVPPSIVGITDNSTYSNAEAESRALVIRCLAPTAKRIETAMSAALLSPESRKTFMIEHDMSGLLRGDLVTRYNAYRVGREGGWLNVNTIRSFENLSNIGPEGETYVQPLNMGIVGQNDNRSKIEDAA